MKLKLSSAFTKLLMPSPTAFQIKKLGMKPKKLAKKKFLFFILKMTGKTFCKKKGIPRPPQNLKAKK